MAISAGSVAVRVVPSAQTFAKDMAAQILPKVRVIGTEIGKEIAAGIGQGIGDPLSGPLDESTKKQRSKAPRQGDAVAGAFAKGFQDRLKAAFAALPKATIDADSSDADRAIADLRARMQALSGKTIGVDIDEGAALAELEALKTELASLDEHPSIQVRVDAAAAAAELAGVQAEVDKLDGDTARVKVDADVSGALAGITTVGFALAGLAAIPVGATLGAGILSLIGPLGAAGIGFGGLAAVAVPALANVKNALQAQKQAASASAAGAVQAQGRALAEAGAQQQLAAAVRNAAAAHQQALSAVRTAEQQLTSAQQSATTAQRALNQARLDAQRQLQDMANQVADAQLAVRQSTFDVADAQRAYNAAVSSPQATQDQTARAKLALDQAKQQQREQTLTLKRLRADQAAADKAGVNGSNQVRSARQQLVAANLQVTNSERALAAARANVARADQNSADQVASARRAVVQASLQSAGANGKLAASMAALSPAQRTLLRDVVGLKGAFSGWARSLEPAVLPLFSRGIHLIQSQLPNLTPVVRGAAGAVDGLITRVGTAAKSPFWTQFRNNLTNLVPTAITGLGRSAGNVVTGLAGIVNAFLPYAPQILSFLTRITAGFARWGQGLGTSSGFAQFIRYVKTNLPLVLGTIGDLVTSVTHVVSALAPLGPSVLGGFGLLLRIVGGLKPGEIQAIAIAIGLVVAAVKVWRIAQLLLNFVLDANPISLIVIGIAALIAAVVLAYNHVGWFRAGVQAAWNGIKVATLFLWNYGLKPVFEIIKFYIVNILVPYYRFLWQQAVITFKGIGAIALWLWHNAIHPAWTGIKAVIGVAWAGIKLYLSALQFEWRLVATVARWLWHNVMVPVWNGIRAVISGVWNNGIKPVFNAVRSAIGRVGDAFHAGASAIKVAWNKIRDYTKAPINFVIGTVYNKGIVGLWNKVMGWLHLPKNLQLGTVPQLAAGGELSAAQSIRPMMTNGPAAIVGEGNPRYPEYVIPTDPKFRGRASALWASAGSDMQMLAGGGILGGVLKTVKGVAGKAVNLGKDALGLLANPKSIWDKLAAPILNKAKGLGTSPWGKAAAAIPPKMMDQTWSVAKQLIDTFKSAFGGGGSSMVELAKTQLGYREGGGNSNKYSHALGRPSEEWCADFINWLALKTGNRSAVPWTASAPGMARGFGNKYHSGTAGAVAGDIVFFGPSKGGIYHVGLASGAGGGGSVPTIAGNSSNMVRAYTGTGVAGYAHPNYPNPGSGLVAPGNLVHASTGAAKAWARQSLKTQGWGQDQFSPLERLWTRESGWRWNALNRSSGAYGIPQSLPASKMRSAGADYHDNAGTQIKWGLGYIRGRYGSPAGAWAHSQRTGWYDEGGWLPPGPSLVYNGTGRPEPVFTGNQFDDMVSGRSGGGVEYHAHFDGLTQAAYESQTRSAFHAMSVQDATKNRVGRRR